MGATDDGHDDLLVFRVVRDEERTQLTTPRRTLGWGVRFPSGGCFVEWNGDAYPPEDRLQRPHVSQYGSFGDVKQATSGIVQPITTHPAKR